MSIDKEDSNLQGKKKSKKKKKKVKKSEKTHIDE